MCSDRKTKVSREATVSTICCREVRFWRRHWSVMFAQPQRYGGPSCLAMSFMSCVSGFMYSRCKCEACRFTQLMSLRFINACMFTMERWFNVVTSFQNEMTCITLIHAFSRMQIGKRFFNMSKMDAGHSLEMIIYIADGMNDDPSDFYRLPKDVIRLRNGAKWASDHCAGEGQAS